MFVLGAFSAVSTQFWTNFVEHIATDPCVVLVELMVTIFIAHYLMKIVHNPEILVEQNGKFHQFLKKHCPAVAETFSPTFWCYGSIPQTIVRPILTKMFVQSIQYKREILALPDGGVIGLDHYGHDTCGPDADVVMVMPGLTGCSQAEYIRQFCIDIKKHFKHAVVVNYRGMGGVPLKTARTYSSTHPEDFGHAVQHIKKNNPNSKILALGISLGGMILTHYLMKTKKPILCAGMAISPAWNAPESAKSLEEPLNWFLFNQLLVHALRSQVHRNRGLFEEAGYNIDHVLESRTIREFDTRFTSHVFGYKSNDDYYEDAAFSHKLDSIKVPLLYLNSADDVFCPRHTINHDFLYTSDTIACVLTQKGGHIGFVDGIFPGPTTYMNRLFIQFMNAVCNHGEELMADGPMTDDDDDDDDY